MLQHFCRVASPGSKYLVAVMICWHQAWRNEDRLSIFPMLLHLLGKGHTHTHAGVTQWKHRKTSNTNTWRAPSVGATHCITFYFPTCLHKADRHNKHMPNAYWHPYIDEINPLTIQSWHWMTKHFLVFNGEKVSYQIWIPAIGGSTFGVVFPVMAIL